MPNAVQSCVTNIIFIFPRRMLGDGYENNCCAIYMKRTNYNIFLTYWRFFMYIFQTYFELYSNKPNIFSTEHIIHAVNSLYGSHTNVTELCQERASISLRSLYPITIQVSCMNLTNLYVRKHIIKCAVLSTYMHITYICLW